MLIDYLIVAVTHYSLNHFIEIILILNLSVAINNNEVIIIFFITISPCLFEIPSEAANKMVADMGTRDMYKMSWKLRIEIINMSFKKQRGAYKVAMRNRFIFISQNLHLVMKNIVMLREIRHDTFHREEAVQAGVFKDFRIFDMRESRMEYEANIFTAQVSLDDEEISEYNVGTKYA